MANTAGIQNTTNASVTIPTAVASEMILAATDHTQRPLLGLSVDVTSKMRAIYPSGVGSYQVQVYGRTELDTPGQDTYPGLTRRIASLTKRTLTINTPKAINLTKTYQLMTTTNADFQNAELVQIAEAAGQDIHASLAATYASGAMQISAAPAANSSGTGLTAALVRQAQEECNKARVPLTGRFLVISPEQLSALLADDDIRNSEFQGTTDGQREGSIGRLYGFDVYVSTLVPTVEDTNSFSVSNTASTNSFTTEFAIFGRYEAGREQMSSFGHAFAVPPQRQSNDAVRTLPQLGLEILYRSGAGGQEETIANTYYGVQMFRPEWTGAIETVVGA